MNAIPTTNDFAQTGQQAEARAKGMFHSTLRIAGKAWSTYWDWRARKATLRALQSLDDRMLKDLGMTRDSLRSDW